MANKNLSLKFLESEHGQKLIDAVKSLTEGIKGLESLFKEILPNAFEEQTLGAETTAKKSKKRTRDPNAPKHPLSSYLLFARDNRPTVKESRPELTPTEIAVELGRMWRELSTEEKDVYVAEAEQLREQYNLENDAYTKSKSEAHVTALPAGEDSSEDEIEEEPEAKKVKTVPAEAEAQEEESSDESDTEPESPVLAAVPVPPVQKEVPKKKKSPKNKENVVKPVEKTILPTPSQPEKKKKKKKSAPVDSSAIKSKPASVSKPVKATSS